LKVATVWAEIRSDWPKREYQKLHKVVEDVSGMPEHVVKLDKLLDEDRDADQLEKLEKEAGDVLGEAFAAASSPENGALVGLYVTACCLDAWERSGDYKPIRCVLNALKATRPDLSSGNGGAPPPATLLLDIVIDLAVAIDDSMAVENGVFCSCPFETAEKAERVAVQMKKVVRRLGDARDDANGQPPDVGSVSMAADVVEGPVGPAHGVPVTSEETIRDIAAGFAEAQRLYFETVANAAHAVAGLVDPARGVRVDIDTAIDAIACAEKNESLRGDVYESELRAHRTTLEALRDAETRPRLRVDRADLVYIYPFALERFDPGGVDGLVNATLWFKGFGAEPIGVEVHALHLTDLWTNPDREESEPGYGGAKIELPSVKVTTTADNELEFDVEVRLSRLGNHHLRVYRRLEDASLHDVNQALRRGSHSMGEEELESVGRTWSRFTEYADAVIEAVAEALGAERVGVPDTSFHVALALRKISISESDATTRPGTLSDLTDAVGASLLFRPVLGYATALEEWVRYPPPVVRNLLRLDDREPDHPPSAGFEGELVARTANTTVLYMPDSPDWRTSAYREMIEFVAAMPPLLRLWERRATAHGSELEEKLPKLKSANLDKLDPSDEELKLNRLEADLREREAEIRKDLGFFHSLALCRDRSQRQFIDALWDAAGLSSLEVDLDRRLAHLSALQERVSLMAAALAERHRQDRARRIERYFQIAGVVFAIASLAEVVSLANDGLDRGHWARVTAEVGLLVAIVAVVLIFLLRKLRPHSAGKPSLVESITIRDLRDEPDDALLRRFYDQVLQPSFDDDELVDFDTLARGVRSDEDPRFLASVAVDDDGSVLGGIVGVLYESTNVLLLAYLAVREDARGRGVGTELVKRVAPGWYADPHVAIAVGEVHDPRVWPEETADARLRLYDRLGGRVLGVPFVQPALGEAGERVRGFLLLVFHADGRARIVREGRDAIRADMLARFVRTYFEKTEGVRPPYDPELAGLLELIEREDAVPLLPVGDYGDVPMLSGRGS
jgi:GNAT superfamily N-acetyltransferase